MRKQTVSYHNKQHNQYFDEIGQRLGIPGCFSEHVFLGMLPCLLKFKKSLKNEDKELLNQLANLHLSKLEIHKELERKFGKPGKQEVRVHENDFFHPNQREHVRTLDLLSLANRNDKVRRELINTLHPDLLSSSCRFLTKSIVWVLSRILPLTEDKQYHVLPLDDVSYQFHVSEVDNIDEEQVESWLSNEAKSTPFLKAMGFNYLIKPKSWTDARTNLSEHGLYLADDQASPSLYGNKSVKCYICRGIKLILTSQSSLEDFIAKEKGYWTNKHKKNVRFLSCPSYINYSSESNLNWSPNWLGWQEDNFFERYPSKLVKPIEELDLRRVSFPSFEDTWSSKDSWFGEKFNFEKVVNDEFDLSDFSEKSVRYESFSFESRRKNFTYSYHREDSYSTNHYPYTEKLQCKPYPNEEKDNTYKMEQKVEQETKIKEKLEPNTPTQPSLTRKIINLTFLTVIIVILLYLTLTNCLQMLSSSCTFDEGREMVG